MIINAYKMEKAKEENKEAVNEVDVKKIIKEVSDFVLNQSQEVKNDKKKEREKITSILYNKYHITDKENIKKIVDGVVDKILGYGILQKYIDNLDISDIRVVNKDSIYVKEKGKWKLVKDTFDTEKELEEYVRFCALKNNANINFETPIAIFSDRKNALRIEAGIEPANVKGPSLVIRVHRKENNPTLENLYVVHNMMDKSSYCYIKEKIKYMDSIVLCGKGGSGKTTLLKALIHKMPKEIAITTNEETAELYLEGRNVIQRECILNRSEESKVDLELLSRHSLVMSNDAIIIGELKGAEANSFFDSISTGHIGLATVHADSTENTIDRLITLIKKDIKAQYYTEEFLRRFLSSSVKYIIYMENFKVKEISKLKYDNKNNKLIFESEYKLV